MTVETSIGHPFRTRVQAKDKDDAVAKGFLRREFVWRRFKHAPGITPGSQKMTVKARKLTEKEFQEWQPDYGDGTDSARHEQP